jgi:parvulin-like peptidyl-prolyl isomerase
MCIAKEVKVMFKGKSLWFILVFVSIVLVSGCNKEKEKQGEVIAKVGKKSFTIEDFMQHIPAQLLVQTSAEERELLLESWVANEIVYKEAVKKGFLKKPEVKEKIEQFKKQLLTNAYLQEVLKEVQFVSDLEARSHFEMYKEDYNSLAEVSHISSSSKEDAEKIHSLIKNGASFSKLAKDYSTDSETADNKGYLGSFRKGELAVYPLFEEAVFSLKKAGEISDVVETEFGFDIIKLHSRKKSPVSYDAIAQSIMVKLRTQKFQKRSKALVDSLKKEYSYEIYPKVLEREMGIPSALPDVPSSLK